MTTERYQQRLQEEEGELRAQLALLESEARDSSTKEVRDEIDSATSDQAAGESLDETSRLSSTLMQVREALQRIQADTYGICVVCGHSIERARLMAVPWSPYCLEDQEKLETQT